MARLPRPVLPGYPYHVTQRGNRRLPTFFEDDDYELYRDLLGEAAVKAGSQIWCYCLMPNHVHVIVVPSDEDGITVPVYYVSLNPVRARLVERPQDWPWSSVRAHIEGRDDDLVRVTPALERYGTFADFLGKGSDVPDAWRSHRRSETSGRPLGSAAWVAALEARTGRTLAPRKRGPKPRNSVI